MTVKKKGKKGGDGTGADHDDESTPPLIIPADIPLYVTLDMRLLNWNYLNFKLRTKTSTRLFAIKQQIQKRHGPICDLKVCKGHFAEANELRNDMDTLADYGIEGAPENDPEVTCLIHYDFKPQQHDNPLLLASEEK